MEDKRLSLEQIQDEHLDNLLRLAFMQMDALEAQEISEEAEKESDPQMQRAGVDAYARFVQKMEAAQREEQRRRRAAAWKKRLPRLIEIAACIVLILGIALPFAVANVASVRSRVMNLLISFQDGYADLDFVPDEQASFEVPDEWIGIYYPAFIPEGYSISFLSEMIEHVEWTDENGHGISFSEHTPDSSVGIDTEDALCSYVTIGGSEALVIEKGGWTMVVWSREDRYFTLRSNETRERTLEIAGSVRRITQ